MHAELASPSAAAAAAAPDAATAELARLHAAAYARDGFVRVAGFLAPAEVAAALAALAELTSPAGLARLPPAHAFFEDPARRETLKQLQSLHLHSAFFGALAAPGGRACRLAEALLGRAVSAVQNVQYFCKAPAGGAKSEPTPPHQDGAYFLLRPADAAVTLWVALDAVDDENGCVRYCVGSHRGGLLPHAPSGVLGFSREACAGAALAAALAREEPQHAAPGDLLAHDPLTVHRAGANASAARTRRAVGLVFYAADAVEDVEAKRLYQQRLEERLVAEGRLLASPRVAS